MPCIVIDTDDVADLCAPPPKRPALQDPLCGPELSFVPTDAFHSSELRDWEALEVSPCGLEIPLVPHVKG